MFQKLEPGNVSYDIAIPSDYMIEKMINNDMLEPIDVITSLTNYPKIDDRFKNLTIRPNIISILLPYMWGTVGIIYNTTMVEEPVDSWNALWDRKVCR